LSDAVLRNVSLQANDKISREQIQELQSQFKFVQEDFASKTYELQKQVEQLKLEKEQTETEKLKSSSDEIQSLKNAVSMHVNKISELENKITNFGQKEQEFENTKHQLAHIDTFRNELVKSQKELEQVKNKFVLVESELNQSKDLVTQKDILIGELTKKIESLPSTPAKKKKVSEVKSDVFNSMTSDSKAQIEDGGSF
jgi:chromosome segregation ATPase